jgi:hypothetical protein
MASTYHVRITENHRHDNSRDLLPTGVNVTLKRPIKACPCIKLVVDGRTGAKYDFDRHQLDIAWIIEPVL